MTRPRNERPEPVEPSWCARTRHDQFPRLHKSPRVIVGPERHRGHGQAFAWLQQADGGEIWLGVGAAHMASATVELRREDAVAFRDLLSRLLRTAGWE